MLKSRRTFPPGGFSFFEPKTGWVSTPGFTFDQVVDEIIRHRRANPRFNGQWNVEPEAVAVELDEYTCVRIAMDPNYCTPGVALTASFSQGRVPLPLWPGLANRTVAAVTKTMAGIGVLLDWLGAGGQAVPKEQSEARATICPTCPKNQPGDWTSHFTGPAIERLRKQLAIKNDLGLTTTHDAELRVCSVCWCHLALKVHTPIKHIAAHLKPDMKAELPDFCWIRREVDENIPKNIPTA